MAQQVEIFNIEFGDTIQSIERLKAELKETRKLFEAAKPNTAEFTKYSNEVKRLDSTIKTLNGATKDNINALGGINNAAKFASGSYGELKQKIEQQKKALLELNVESEDFAKTQESLIELQNKRIEIEKKIPSLFQERIKGAIDESNSLKQLRIDLKAAQAAALNGDGAAAKKVAELKDKIDDLKDSTKSLQGSGVERLNTSMALLTEGFANFDSEKLSTGFKGIGAAMSAIPIVLLIEGIKALIDNFDEIVAYAKKLTGGFNEAERQVTKLTKAIEQQTFANKALATQYENQIALLTAQGASEKELTEAKKKKLQVDLIEAENQLKLNSAKAAAILLNDNVTESYERMSANLLKKLGRDKEAALYEKALNNDKKERAKEEIQAAQDAAIQVSKLKNDLLVLDAEYNKKQAENAKKLVEDKKKILEEEADAWWAKTVAEQEAEHELYLKLTAQQEQLEKSYIDSLNYILEQERLYNEQRLQNNVDAAKTKLLVEERTGGDILAAKLELLKAEEEQELAAVEDNEIKKAEIRERYRQQETQAKLASAQSDLQVAQGLTNSLAELSDAYYTVQRSNLEKGTQEDRDAAEDQFNTRKALSIVTTLINGAVAVVNAFATLPFYANVAAAAAVGITTTANVAKIASQKFEYYDGGYTGEGNPKDVSTNLGTKDYTYHKDEYVIPSKVLNTPQGSLMASQLEAMRKGITPSGISGFYDGGFTNRSASRQVQNDANMQSTLMQFMSNIPAPVVKVTDINRVNKSSEVSVNVANL